MLSTPEIPTGVLLQSLSIDAEGQTAGYRIYADGRYETRPSGQTWQFQTPLNPTQLQQVQEVLAEVDFENLAPHYRPDKSVEDPGVLWFQVVRDERPYSIAIESGCHVPAIEALSANLVEIFRGS